MLKIERKMEDTCKWPWAKKSRSLIIDRARDREALRLVQNKASVRPFFLPMNMNRGRTWSGEDQGRGYLGA